MVYMLFYYLTFSVMLFLASWTSHMICSSTCEYSQSPDCLMMTQMVDVQLQNHAPELPGQYQNDEK